MSLYKKSNRLIHFVHIPKTGGTSIRKLLDKNQWENVTPEIHPSLSHEIYSFPQHKTSSHQHRNLWNHWSVEIDEQFTIVRNPYTRCISQLLSNLSQLDIDPAQFENYYLTKFFKLIVEQNLLSSNGIGDFDNHFRPQTDFIGDKTKIFKYEIELDDVVDYLKSKDIIKHTDVLERHNIRTCKKNFKLDFKSFPGLYRWYMNLRSSEFRLFNYNEKDESLILI